MASLPPWTFHPSALPADADDSDSRPMLLTLAVHSTRLPLPMDPTLSWSVAWNPESWLLASSWHGTGRNDSYSSSESFSRCSTSVDCGQNTVEKKTNIKSPSDLKNGNRRVVYCRIRNLRIDSAGFGQSKDINTIEAVEVFCETQDQPLIIG